MSDYRAPVKDMRFVMDELAGFRELSQYPDFAEATPDMADAILEEAAKFTREVLAPLNRVGDKAGCQFDGGRRRHPAGLEGSVQGILRRRLECHFLPARPCRPRPA